MASSIPRPTSSTDGSRPVRDKEHFYGGILQAIAVYDMDHLLRAMTDEGLLIAGEYVGSDRKHLIELILTSRKEQRFLDFLRWYADHAHRKLLQATEGRGVAYKFDDPRVHGGPENDYTHLSQESGNSGTSGSTSPMELEFSPPNMTQLTVRYILWCVV